MKKIIKRIFVKILIKILSRCEKCMLLYVFDKVNQNTINSTALDEALIDCMLGK